MKLSSVRRGVLLALAIGAAACTTTPTTPSTPVTTLSSITNPTPQVSGVFQGPMVLSFVGGGTGPLADVGVMECVSTEFQKRVNTGINDASLVLTQDKTDPTSVTAQLNSNSTGLSCKYTGNIGSSNSLALNGDGACQASLQILCPRVNTDGTTTIQPLTLTMQSTTMSGTFDGWPVNVSALRGTVASTYNVSDGGGFVARYGSNINPVVLAKK
jgi:hypothetical protein